MKSMQERVVSRRRVMGAAGGAFVGIGIGRELGHHGARPVAAKGDRRLYRGEGEATARLIAVNGPTLADDEGFPAIAIDEAMVGSIVVSGDGATIAFARGTTVVIRERATGLERVVENAAGGWPIAISHGGLRLIVERWQDQSATWQWLSIDLAAGRIVTTVEGTDQLTRVAVDDSLLRLFRLRMASSSSATGPGPVSLVAYDLLSGAEMGQAAIPGLLGGAWMGAAEVGGKTIDGVYSYLLPGLALAPGERRVAIVHPAGEAVTTIDAMSMTPLGTARTTEKRSAVERALGWFSLAPRGAAAKMMAGSEHFAVYAADARSVYVSGVETRMEETRIVREGAGLRRIDGETGIIEAVALEGEEIDRLLPLGEDLFVTARRDEFGGTRLYRLDPWSLAVLAERDLAGWQVILAV